MLDLTACGSIGCAGSARSSEASKNRSSAYKYKGVLSIKVLLCFDFDCSKLPEQGEWL